MNNPIRKQPSIRRELYQRAVLDSFRKLDPRVQVRNPVMFVVEVGSLLTTGLWIQALFGQGEAAGWHLSARWRSGCGLRCCLPTSLKRWPKGAARPRPRRCAKPARRPAPRSCRTLSMSGTQPTNFSITPSTQLRQGDKYLVEAGDIIPADGEVIDGIASVDESAVTGESAPVIRESGGDRSAVTGGTRILSDWLVIQVTANPGEGFLDRMISLVEGAKRQKTPNEIALNILLAAFTIIFLGVCITLLPYSLYSVQSRRSEASRLPSPCWWRCWCA